MTWGMHCNVTVRLDLQQVEASTNDGGRLELAISRRIFPRRRPVVNLQLARGPGQGVQLLLGWEICPPAVG